MAARGVERRLGADCATGAAGYPERPLCARVAEIDERTLDLLAGAVDAVAIRVESHLGELAGRLGAEPAETEERLRQAVRLCRERDVAGGEVVFECSVTRRLRADGAEPALRPPYDITAGTLYV
jgi:hypothetical protein